MAPHPPDSSEGTPVKREHSSSDNEKPSPKRQPIQTKAVQGQEQQAQLSDTGAGPMRDLITTNKGTAEGRLERERDPGSVLAEPHTVRTTESAQQCLKKTERIDEQCGAQEKAPTAGKTVLEEIETECRRIEQELKEKDKEPEEKGKKTENTSSRLTSSMGVDLRAVTNARDLMNRVRILEENREEEIEDFMKGYIKENNHTTRLSVKEIRDLKACAERASEIQKSLMGDLSESANQKVNELMNLLTLNVKDARQANKELNDLKSGTYKRLGSSAFTVPMFETFRDTMPRWFRQKLEELDEGSLITEDAMRSQQNWAMEAKIPVEAAYVHMMVNVVTLRRQDPSRQRLMAWLSVVFVIEWKARLEDSPYNAKETLAKRIADTHTWFVPGLNEKWREAIYLAQDLVQDAVTDKKVDSSWRQRFHSAHLFAYMYTLSKAQQSKSVRDLTKEPLSPREIWPFWKAIVNDDCMSFQGLMENPTTNVSWGKFARTEDGIEDR